MPENKKKFVTILVPACNEEITIAEFMRWCHEGLAKAGVEGEILIADSSTDRTPEIAESMGARVLRLPKRGLGQAYIDAIPHIKGDYVILGDADCTYDFRKIDEFLKKLDEGYEFVMGSRMRGQIEKNAMPPLHQYFGTPLTTFLLNCISGTKFSDIHCGLRALTTDALRRIQIRSRSWEYASEMLVKANLLKLRYAEVPIPFYKDREGRESHYKRAGWFEPWYGGWITLKIMFLYAPNSMIVKPGLVFLSSGLALILMQAAGPVAIGAIRFSTSFMMLGLALAVLGTSCVEMGILVYTFSELSRYCQNKLVNRLRRDFTYTTGMLIGSGSFALGLLCSAVFIYFWYVQNFDLRLIPWYAVMGLFLIIFGIQTILFNLVYQSFRQAE